ncbi:hypothetical protein FXV77_09275 [Sphingobacterium phlebotomi]|uniref:Uncharacterized protein n=1 Tax=Sphingobacterium phlebotomi TaxID=2605433 RepID=A0A5D4HD00_9SPHI|nr:hypothetical protein FXV77_09275 [Sphingobacterium phlebotomi]
MKTKAIYLLLSVARALAAFQRTLKSRGSRFDKFLDGKYYALHIIYILKRLFPATHVLRKFCNL